MKISIITPVYNGEKFIRRTMDSIHSQKGDFELEHIVCDGQSTDHTLEILKDYPAARVISRKDGGPCQAINYGMNLATGDIAAWLNADDLYLPGALQTVCRYFQKHAGCQWLYGNCGIIDQDDREIRKPVTLYKNILGFFYSRNLLLCENYINQPATFWKTDFWRSLNGLDTRYKGAWDYELWLQMARQAPAQHIHERLASFRRHNDSISENFFEQQFTEEMNIARQYGNFLHHCIHRFNHWKNTFVYRLLK